MENKLELLLADALKKCKTHAHMAKSSAKDLEDHGFHGEVVADLIGHAEMVLKYSHAYQSYINVLPEIEAKEINGNK